MNVKSVFISIRRTAVSGRFSTAVWVVILALAGITIYANSLHAPFMYDDLNFITLNDPHVQITELSWSELKDAAVNGKPRHRLLPNLSFAFNYYFGGTDPAGYHAVNVAIHLITGILLFLFFKTVIALPAANRGMHSSLSSEMIAGAAALIWLVHPLQTQAVTYIAQRMTSIAALFLILSCLLYVKARLAMRNGRFTISLIYFTGLLLSGAAAISSKQNTAILPILILLFEWFFFQRAKMPAKYWCYLLAALAIFTVVALIYLGDNPVHRIAQSYKKRDFTLVERLLTEPRVVIYYIGLILFPHPGRLNIDYDYPLSASLLNPQTALLTVVCLLAVLVCTLFMRDRYPVQGFCILWFMVNLLIESSFIGIEIIYEHRLYIPSMMICLAAALLWAMPNKSHRSRVFISIAVLTVFSAWTWQRNSMWNDEIAFWQDCVRKSPGKSRPYQNLAYTYQLKGSLPEAIALYRKSLEIGPDWTSALYNLATALMEDGQYYEAIHQYYQALNRVPAKAQTHRAVAEALKNAGDLEKARKHLEIAAALDPGDSDSRAALAELDELMTRYPNPMPRIRWMIAQQPNNPALHVKLGELLEERKNIIRAIDSYQAALMMTPSNQEILMKNILNRLSAAYAGSEQYGKAIEVIRKNIALFPDDAALYYNMASIYAARNQAEEAVRWLRRAREKGYENWERCKEDENFENILKTPCYQKLINPD